MNPAITVIVPYYNEKDSIAYTLERVGEQSLPATTAIFVNSSSSDDTSVVIDRWIRDNQHRFSTRFLNLFEHTDNPASSKNVGIRHAVTEWLAFMDCGQNFDKTWLAQQFLFAQDNRLDVVSGVAYLVGENWVDRCAAAQTYGYRRNRPCVPTTLARKSVFEKTGLFLEGRRAGYDAAWIRSLAKLAIARGVNEDVKITYIGFNFSSNLPHLYRKSVLYAKPSVALEGYWMPYAYAVAPLLFALLTVVSICAALAVVLLYFLARTFFVPIMKSRSIAFFKEHPWQALLGLGVVGLVIDLGKTVGTWQGIRCYYFKNSGAAGR
jgi:glycosyltransferase involved in cell wall biosynthesis